jgi:hypothetical protein
MPETPKRIPDSVVKKARKLFADQKRQQIEHKERYGEVHPLTTMEAFGKRMVAVGNTIYADPKWKYFTDFLRDYVPETFGAGWVNAENAKADSDRHLITQCWIESRQYMASQPLPRDGSHKAPASGAHAALMAFSYDLYIVANNGGLDEALLHRLRIRDVFQGARHELFAEATCLSSGTTLRKYPKRISRE